MIMAQKKKFSWNDIFSCTCFSNPKCEETKQLFIPPKHEQYSLPCSSLQPQRLSLTDIAIFTKSGAGGGGEGGSQISIDDLSSSLVGSNLHAFSLDEIRSITKNFTSANFLGGGGFGAVYKGFISDRVRTGLEAQVVAVKVLDLEGTQGHKEWLAEVIFLGQLRHRHLVKLTGYCCENDQRMLIYEYMERGNLDEKLFRRCFAPLPWLTRLKIALDAAMGLAFLHGEKKPVIFRDFKAANILLASDFTAKLSDFGFARDGPEDDKTHVSTNHRLGTRGYAAPEYIMTGHLTTMSDVYSYGVVLLELLTGRRSIDKSRQRREQNLVEWARPQLKNARKIESIMDPRLEGQYSSQGVRIAATLAYQCLSHYSKSRPSMSTVVKTLEAVLDMKDDFLMPGPFVYVVPTSASGGGKKKSHAVKEKNEDAGTEEGGKVEDGNIGIMVGVGRGGGEGEGEGEGERKKKRRKRRRRRASRDRAVHSDSALDRYPIKLKEWNRN